VHELRQQFLCFGASGLAVEARTVDGAFYRGEGREVNPTRAEDPSDPYRRSHRVELAPYRPGCPLVF
jgi:hypothetical protein